jgi:hypothetical protein
VDGAIGGRVVTVKQTLDLMIFVGSAALAGLAAIHFIWHNPAVIGPFALMIGMTPLVVLFEYSLEIPGFWFLVGAVLASVSWFPLRRNPPSPMAVKIVILVGGAQVATAISVFIFASAYYNVGMAGEIPPAWAGWVRPGSRIGAVGLVILASGLLMKAKFGQSCASS